MGGRLIKEWGKVDRLEILNIHVLGTADFVWGQVFPTPVSDVE